jgi:hypothetical protein
MTKPNKATPQPVLSFVRTEDVETRSLIEINGVEAAVLTRTHVISPASVTVDDIERHVKQVARKTDPADPESYWEVELPGLESVEWSEYGDLAAEVANQLNGEGVSVTDWPPYKLDD